MLVSGEFIGDKPVGEVKAIDINPHGCSVAGLGCTHPDVKKPAANDPKDGELSVVRMKGV